jgi:hypothetical protein
MSTVPGQVLEGMLGVSSHITTLMMGTEIVPETLVSTCNQLTWLCAQEDFIEFSRRKSFKLYIKNSCFHSFFNSFNFPCRVLTLA